MILMRTDIFEERKSVHIKLDKDVHCAIREKLFKHNITMQDLFEEFARLVASESPRGQTMITTVVEKKIKQAIEGKPKRRQLSFSELDSETIYSILSKENNKE